MVLTLGLFIGRLRWFRRMLDVVAGVFNERIRFSIQHGVWTLWETLQRLRLSLPLFVAHSVAMWTAYLASYWCLGKSLGITVRDVASMFLSEPWKPTGLSVLRTGNFSDQALLILYLLCPIVFIGAYALMSRRYDARPKLIVQWFSDPELFLGQSYHRRQRFSSDDQYRSFLRRTFAGEANLLAEFDGAEASGNTVLHRIFHGGSDALTALVQTDGSLVVRKFASKKGFKKLADQCNWLEHNKSLMPLVTVQNSHTSNGYFFYDMPYSSSSREFFEYIHTSSEAAAWSQLEAVLERIDAFHRATTSGAATNETINVYVQTKMRDNFLSIMESAPLLFQHPTLLVNDKPLDMARIKAWVLDEDKARELKTRTTATIHGDLTIENVLIDGQATEGWFLIDPNIGNVFESPLLDYAKLMQSLHLGYEALNRDPYCRISDNGVRISLHRSSQYAFLHACYEKWLAERFGSEVLLEVRLHEIIHYLRLTPYKFRRSPIAGLAFTACTLLLIGRYLEEVERC
ncbi:hypothetical protein DAMDJJ_14725 [Cupriavidus necator]